jgi:hypothetical protein
MKFFKKSVLAILLTLPILTFAATNQAVYLKSSDNIVKTSPNSPNDFSLVVYNRTYQIYTVFATLVSSGYVTRMQIDVPGSGRDIIKYPVLYPNNYLCLFALRNPDSILVNLGCHSYPVDIYINPMGKNDVKVTYQH